MKVITKSPFNLEKAKAGQPLVTRAGHQARLLGTIRDDDEPVVAAVLMPCGCCNSTDCADAEESVESYNLEGRYLHDGSASEMDLFMKPQVKVLYIGIRNKVTDGVYGTTNAYENNSGLSNYPNVVKVEVEMLEND